MTLVFLGLTLDVRQRLLLPFAKFFFDVLAARPIMLAFKGGGDGGAPFLHEPLHIPAELGPVPRWQSQRARFMRLHEIIHVAPIRWGRVGGRLTLEVVAHHGILLGALRAQREQIEALAADTLPDPYRLDGPRLTNAHSPVFQIC